MTKAPAECVDSLEKVGYNCLLFAIILWPFVDELLGETLSNIIIPGILRIIPDEAKRLQPWDNGILHE